MMSDRPDLPPAVITDAIRKLLVRDLLERYCRAIDRQLWDEVRDCYADDATHHHGMFVGTATDFIDYVSPHFTTMLGTQHVITNLNVTGSDRKARSEAYAIAFHRMPSSSGGTTDQTVWYRYLDSLTYVEGVGWRIAARKVVYDWSRIDKVDREWQLGRGYIRGQRDHTDDSIQHLDGH